MLENSSQLRQPSKPTHTIKVVTKTVKLTQLNAKYCFI